MKTQVIFLGAPGSGKGTQASMLSEYLNIPHIDTGSMLRAAVAEGTEYGKLAKSCMDQGQLVPSEIVVGIIKERLQKPDTDKGFILDGFPRSIEQAESLDNILKDIINKEISAVLNVDVSEDVLVDRMAYRKSCNNCGAKYNMKFFPPKNDEICDKCGGKLTQRSDDTVENAERRISTYKKETQPLIDYYSQRNLIKDINGNQSINMIFDDLKKTLNI